MDKWNIRRYELSTIRHKMIWQHFLHSDGSLESYYLHSDRPDKPVKTKFKRLNPEQVALFISENEKYLVYED